MSEHPTLYELGRPIPQSYDPANLDYDARDTRNRFKVEKEMITAPETTATVIQMIHNNMTSQQEPEKEMYPAYQLNHAG